MAGVTRHAELMDDGVDVEGLVVVAGALKRETHAGGDRWVADHGGPHLEFVARLLVGLRLGVRLDLILL